MSGDPHWQYVSTLLDFNGENGSNQIVDRSQNANQFVAYGNAQISTLQSKFGNSSLKLDGAGDYLLCTNSLARLDSGDHTVEFWFYPIETPSDNKFIWGQYYAGAPGRAYISFNSNRNIILQLGQFAITSETAYSLNEWHHVAWDRIGDNNVLYVDGISIGAFSSSINIENSKVWIGCQNTGTNDSPVTAAYFNGYIDEIRITKGIARHTENFTPTEEAFQIGPLLFSGGGVAKFSDGAVATLVRVWEAASGTHLTNIIPDPTTGDFQVAVSSQTVYLTALKTGYRPLTHGPITLNA